MKIKDSPASNITFIALMSAINALFAFFVDYLPAISILFYLFLPFITTLTLLVTKRKYFILYVSASIFLSLITNFSGIEYTIFTLLPSLITGTIFGCFLRARISIGLSILVAAMSQFLFSLITIPIINAFYTNSRSVIEIFAAFLGNDKAYLTNMLFLPLIFVTSLSQNIISFLIISSELKRLNIMIEFKNNHSIAYSFCSLFFIILSCLSSFLWQDLMYLFLAFSITTCAISLSSYDYKKTSTIILISIAALFTIIFAIILSSNNMLLYVPLATLGAIFVFTFWDIYLFSTNKRSAKIR